MSGLTVVLWSTDIDALVEFLAKTAGANVTARHPGFAALAIGEAQLEVHADEAYAGHPWFDALKREGAARGIGSELRIEAEGVDAIWDEAIQQGGIGIQPPADTGQTYECAVMGPDGYLFSFWQSPQIGS